MWYLEPANIAIDLRGQPIILCNFTFMTPRGMVYVLLHSIKAFFDPMQMFSAKLLPLAFLHQCFSIFVWDIYGEGLAYLLLAHLIIMYIVPRNLPDIIWLSTRCLICPPNSNTTVSMSPLSTLQPSADSNVRCPAAPGSLIRIFMHIQYSFELHF